MNLLDAKKALVLAAHPDDETLGVGGTIQRLVKNGCEVHVTFYTEGEEGFADPRLKDDITKIRGEEIKMVQKILGFQSFEFVGYKDMDVPNDKEALKRTIGVIRRVKPDVIFTHYHKDKHRDHRAISELSGEAWWQSGENVCADLGKPWKVKQLYEYEVLDLFQPTHILDISEEFSNVCAAVRKYSSQMDVLPNVLKISEGIAMVRGGQIGVRYGEGLAEHFCIPTPLG